MNNALDISKYLEYMVGKSASDIFFSPNAPVLIKVNGVAKPVSKDVFLTPKQVRDLAYSVMQDRHIAEFEEHWDTNLALSIPDLGRFRVNIMRQKNEVAMVIRSIKKEPPPISSLNLPSFIPSLVMGKRGLILVAGATGSGKSTTLASMIDYRNEHKTGHILTIEDPIEYMHGYKNSIINQREVGSDTKSFSSALKNAMREAPDVILIGEIRDSETMKQAMIYAETGHLCLATIHASNAVETLDRVINFFPDEHRKQLLIDLSHNLRAIICQRLVKGKDGTLYPAIETLIESPFITELIQKGKIDEIKSALERNLENDAVTFDQAIFELYKKEVITEDEALSNADSRHNVSVQIRLLDHGELQESGSNLHYEGESDNL